MVGSATSRNNLPGRPLRLVELKLVSANTRVGQPVKEQQRYWEHDEVIVCMVLAFCIGNAIITLAYRLAA
jgi:hypothetical protein